MSNTSGGDYLGMMSEFLAGSGKSPPFSVKDLIEAAPDLKFSVIAGKEALDRRISAPKVQLLGLALQGFTDDLDPGSVQIIGRAEMRYIQVKASARPEKYMDPTFQSDIGCIVMPDAQSNCRQPGITDDFLEGADQAGLPILCSPVTRTVVEARLLDILEERLAPSLSLHGELVVFRGMGLLIIGKSGIGKSDCALDLIMHGHQLVADDVVHVRRNPLGQLIGRSRDLIRHHMDISGLGIVNISELFSAYHVLEEHAVDLVILLEPWDDGATYCFSEREFLEILDVRKPMIRIPVTRGRNWVNLIHVAVRRFLKESSGERTETQLVARLDQLLNQDQT